VEGHATLDDFLKANRYMTHLFSRRTGDGRGEDENDRTGSSRRTCSRSSSGW
jgi:MoxR-like ATPase